TVAGLVGDGAGGGRGLPDPVCPGITAVRKAVPGRNPLQRHFGVGAVSGCIGRRFRTDDRHQATGLCRWQPALRDRLSGGHGRCGAGLHCADEARSTSTQGVLTEP
nr:hypothetical protein [Tanacetum cinerariifolium]